MWYYSPTIAAVSLSAFIDMFSFNPSMWPWFILSSIARLTPTVMKSVRLFTSSVLSRVASSWISFLICSLSASLNSSDTVSQLSVCITTV